MAAVIIAVAACKPEKTDLKVEPISVVTEEACTTTDYLNKTYVGTIEEYTSTPISFTGMGKVTRVCVEEGQRVTKGQVIAEIDEAQAKNMLATAEAQMAQANDALGRMKQLYEAGSLPEIKWVEVQSQVAQAKSQLDMARQNVADCRIHAPVSGVVSSKTVSDGMTAVTAEPVITILDISNVWVRVAIPEKEIAAIKPSTRTTVQVEATGTSMEGGRIEKCLTADATTHTYDIKISLPNRDGALLPGMIANVRMLSGGKKDVVSAITLPVRCVQQAANGNHFVWIVKNAKAHRQPIVVGDTFGNRIVVSSGLEGGEVIITEGYQKVGEGTKVTH